MVRHTDSVAARPLTLMPYRSPCVKFHMECIADTPQILSVSIMYKAANTPNSVRLMKGMGPKPGLVAWASAKPTALIPTARAVWCPAHEDYGRHEDGAYDHAHRIVEQAVLLHRAHGADGAELYAAAVEYGCKCAEYRAEQGGYHYVGLGGDYL